LGLRLFDIIAPIGIPNAADLKGIYFPRRLLMINYLKKFRIIRICRWVAK